MGAAWIKVRKDIDTDPDVIAIADYLKCTKCEVVGRLIRVWSWADTHLVDGNAPSVTRAKLGKTINDDSILTAMVRVGWLAESEGGVVFPKFDRHLSQSAKRRALTNERVAKARKNVTQGALQDVTQDALHVTQRALTDKIREDNPYIPLPDRGDFHKLCAVYPYKINFGNAHEEYAKIPPESVEDVLQAAKNYAAASASRNHHDARLDKWLASGEWRRWVNTPTVVDPHERSAQLAKARLPWS